MFVLALNLPIGSIIHDQRFERHKDIATMHHVLLAEPSGSWFETRTYLKGPPANLHEMLVKAGRTIRKQQDVFLWSKMGVQKSLADYKKQATKTQLSAILSDVEYETLGPKDGELR